MLERIWRKGNPLELLVGIQTDIATVGTVWGFLKRLGTKLSYDLAFFDFFKSTKIYFFTMLYLFSILKLKSIYLKTEPLALDFPGSSAGKKSTCNAGDPSWITGSGRSPEEGVAQMVKNLPPVWDTWVQSLVWEDPLEEGIATHSSILAWRLPWTEEPGRLQPMGLQRIGHEWVTRNKYLFLYWSLCLCLLQIKHRTNIFGFSVLTTPPPLSRTPLKEKQYLSCPWIRRVV